jgi:hypothetical protein
MLTALDTNRSPTAAASGRFSGAASATIFRSEAPEPGSARIAAGSSRANRPGAGVVVLAATAAAVSVLLSAGLVSSRIDGGLASLRIVGDVESGRRESSVGRVYAYAGSRAGARRAGRAAPSSGRAAQRPSMADTSGAWPRGERERRRRQSRAPQVRRRRDGIVSGPACDEEDDADAMPNAYATLHPLFNSFSG